MVPGTETGVRTVPGTASAGEAGETVVIGSKKFTESVILGEIAVGLVDSALGDGAARHRDQLGGTRVLWGALLGGDIDVYPEYTGTLEQEIFAERRIDGRPVRGLEALRTALAAEGLALGAPLGFDNTYALGMRAERAAELGVETISDLAALDDLRLGFTNEFMDRGDGWPGLRAAYGLPQRAVGLDHDLAYRGLVGGTLDVVDLYSTDAEIREYGLHVLRDDRGYFPEYQAVFLWRRKLETRAPQAVAALRRLEGRIPAERMVELNARTKIDGVPETQVAADFLDATFGLEVVVDEETRLERFVVRSREHLGLVGVSLGLAILCALPLGIVAARRPLFGQLALGVAGILQTIPALALLVFMIPLLGIGAVPAMAALFLYSLLPILRNTVTGLASIPPELSESARALGLDAWARLRHVELPLAARSILAGIKVSAVINIGTATLGALIGAGGYGQPILTGIRLDDLGLILEGAVPAAGLALLVQGLFELVERWLVPAGLRGDDA
ncbi:MAG: glycine betaine ABC transporter substrate-binding protein [Acidobacteriota bacterium]